MKHLFFIITTFTIQTGMYCQAQNRSPYYGRPPYGGSVSAQSGPGGPPGGYKSDVKCPSSHSTGQYPYYADCTSFINCWNGQAFLQQCGPGTLFNPKTRVCDWPSNVDCNYGNEPKEPPCSKPKEKDDKDQWVHENPKKNSTEKHEKVKPNEVSDTKVNLKNDAADDDELKIALEHMAEIE